MKKVGTTVVTVLRIPGDWSGPQELMQRLPEGHRLTPDLLVLPDGTEIGFHLSPRDSEFCQVFQSACRLPPTAREIEIVNRYTVNAVLFPNGGSPDAARTILKAGAAILRAGAAGVFIDNSALAHGGELWLEMAEDGGPDALSFAFVNIVRGKQDVYTSGMHLLGFREIVVRRAERASDCETIVEFARYLCTSPKPVGDGHILADENGPRYQVKIVQGDKHLPSSPMHNPFGRFRLVSVQDIAESN